ncbi:MAG: hypothetical protein ACO33A_05845, partial [Hyphomonas sp.]
MRSLLPLLSTLLSLMQFDMGRAVSRRARGVGLMLIAALFLLTAYVLAVGALAVYLSGRISPSAALGVIALGLLAAAGILFGCAAIGARVEQERVREAAAARQQAALGALTDLLAGGVS